MFKKESDACAAIYSLKSAFKYNTKIHILFKKTKYFFYLLGKLSFSFYQMIKNVDIIFSVQIV